MHRQDTQVMLLQYQISNHKPTLSVPAQMTDAVHLSLHTQQQKASGARPFYIHAN